MDKYIDFLLNVKLTKFKRENLESLTYKQLRKVMYSTKWILKMPTSLSQIASDIDSLTFNEVAEFLMNNNSVEETVAALTQELEDTENL